jgi:anti-sigma B factor antagonist
MEIGIRKAEDAVILDLKGNFDVNTSDFIEVVGELLRQGYKKILCNFDGVNMIDYMGLSGLAIAFKNVRNHTGALKFYNVPVHVKKVFSTLLLDSVFEIYFSEEEALKSFEQAQVFAAIAEQKLRRRFKRLPIHLTIKFKSKFGSSKGICEGTMLNLSAIGFFIFTKDVYNLNDILQVWLPLGSEKATVEVEGRVVWLADKNIQPQLSPGMGVEFYKISTKLQKRIVDFVDRNLPRQEAIDT